MADEPRSPDSAGVGARQVIATLRKLGRSLPRERVARRLVPVIPFLLLSALRLGLLF